MTKYVIELSREPYYLKEDLKHLRIWFDGYTANGGEMPPAGDVIRQLEVIINNIQKPPVVDDATVKLRAKMIDGFDAIDNALGVLSRSFLEYDYVATTPKAPEAPVVPEKAFTFRTYKIVWHYNGSTDRNTTIQYTTIQYATSKDHAEATFLKNNGSTRTIISIEEW